MKTKRVWDKTPAGGDYSEIFFLDDKHNVVEDDVATMCVIRECTKDGNLLKETWGICNNKRLTKT